MHTSKAITFYRSEKQFLYMPFLLFLLSLMDAIATDYGLRNGIIEEFNKLILIVYESSIFSFYLIKILLPLFIVKLFPFVLKNPILKLSFQFAIFLYGVVFLYHIGWISYVHFIM